MNPMNCSLTIIAHRSLADELIDHLLEHPEWVHGFSLTCVEGGSRREKLRSMIEQVRGRSQGTQIVIVMNLDDARDLIGHLKKKESNRDVAYWISPVLEFGWLA